MKSDELIPPQTMPSKTILLLISDHLVQSVIQAELEGAGYIVLPAGDLGSAVDWLTRTKPDLLIVRRYILSVSGHEAAEYLRDRCNHMRVLMLDGVPDVEDLKDRDEIAGFEVFPKPFAPAALLQKVKEVLDQVP